MDKLSKKQLTENELRSIHLINDAIKYNKGGFTKQITLMISKEKNDLIKQVTSKCRDNGIKISRDDLIHVALDYFLGLVQDEHDSAIFCFEDEEDNIIHHINRHKKIFLQLRIKHYEKKIEYYKTKTPSSHRDKINFKRNVERHEMNLKWAKKDLNDYLRENS